MISGVLGSLGNLKTYVSAPGEINSARCAAWGEFAGGEKRGGANYVQNTTKEVAIALPSMFDWSGLSMLSLF